MFIKGRWGRLSYGLLLSLCMFSISPVEAGEPFFTDLEDTHEWYSETNQAYQPDLFGNEILMEQAQETDPGEEIFSAGEPSAEGGTLGEAFFGEASFGESFLGEAFSDGEREGASGLGALESLFFGTEEGGALFGSEESCSPFEGLEAYAPDPLPQQAREEPLKDSWVGLPSSYDARAGFLSPVKNQRPYGSCWAFTLTGAMEASLLKQGLGLYDLSEDHLAYFFSHRENDPLGNTGGDANINLSGEPFAYLQGGQSTGRVGLFLSTWSGMALTDLVPYPTDEGHVEMLPTKARPQMAYETSAYLSDLVFSSQDSIERYKSLIYTYGSLSVNLYMDEDYYQEETHAYSYPSRERVNHSVLLVGWEDAYPAQSFAKACAVSGDGAFIARNSWGEDWGEGGYFYISYEAALTGGVALSGTTRVSYPNNYFYDGTGSLVWASLPQGEALANVFQAKGGGGACEVLGEVVVADYSEPSDYQVQVYTQLSDPSDPRSGKPAFDEPLSYHKELSGVGTFSLPREVALLPGSFFSVELKNAGTDPIHYLVDQSSRDNGYAYESVCGENQSFWFDGQASWYDLSREASPLCARIKAHTRGIKKEEALGDLEKSRITVGEATQLRIEYGGDISCLAFESSDQEVATVTAQGVVQGRRAGLTLISCRTPDGRVGVALPLWVEEIPAPQELYLTPKSYKKIQLSWSSVEGASGYLLYRGRNGEAPVYFARCELPSFADTEVVLGETYTYQVGAYKTLGETCYQGGLSAPCQGSARDLDAPASLTAQVKKGQVVLSWDKVSGASGYRIFKKVGSGSFKRLQTLEKGSLTALVDADVVPGKKYVYKVKAYREVNKVRYFGSSKTSSVVTLPQE